ncbi:hypothetical protein KFE98_11760 [bacterium SCSIO 12741]|nr:hypothetical protein KFE98_11760 [bacterium SCSIO 12741]
MSANPATSPGPPPQAPPPPAPPIRKAAPAPQPRKLGKGKMSGLSFQSKLVSVKDMMNKVDEEKTEEISEEELLRNKPRDPFKVEDLNKLWKEYAKNLQGKSRSSLASTMLTNDPEMDENWKLKVMLDNKVMQNEMNQEKVEILSFLRERLNNYGIQIETEVRVEVQKKRYYTNRERFDRMMELNPKLQDLRTRLNLDPDF